MNTEQCKNRYIAPMIERIKLDNMISLALESTPPEGPGEVKLLNSPECNDNIPFYA